jgi:cobalt/nickel transport protein
MFRKTLLTGAALLLLSSPALAHFGMVIPSDSVIDDQKQAAIEVQLSFSHPMECNGMQLAQPAVKVFSDGKAKEFGYALQPVKVMEHDAWKLPFTFKKPGVYQFIMEPTPYWEPAEDCYIIHYTKTIISAFGEEEGWDEPAGLKTEIVPLSRPFGNYAGNVFQGQVLLDGKPAPGTEVEIEYYNKDGKYEAPNNALVTQVVKADANGVFTYGVPFAGWWGFAALNTAEEKIAHEGTPKDVEIGAVLWVEFSQPLLKK